MTKPQRTRLDLSRFRLALRDHSERVNLYADWYYPVKKKQVRRLAYYSVQAKCGLQTLQHCLSEFGSTVLTTQIAGSAIATFNHIFQG